MNLSREATSFLYSPFASRTQDLQHYNVILSISIQIVALLLGSVINSWPIDLLSFLIPRKKKYRGMLAA